MSTKKLVTILLPCLNEERTLEKCIVGIKKTMDKSKYKDKYTILVCDNNSTDNSVNICKKNKVDYLICKERGQGAALKAGINKSKTEYLAMLDSDGSYDERDLPKMLDLLKDYDLVVGNRFKGTIEHKAMPKKNRIGSTFLTIYNNILFHTPIHDHHCGMRVFKRKEMLKFQLESDKFEFATEMIIKAKVYNLKMIETPTNLFKDGRDRKPHLKPFKDGIACFYFANKVKWQNSILFRYLTTFIIGLLFLISLLFLSQLIPHNSITKNTLKSKEELKIQFKHKRKQKSNSIYEKVGDIRLLSIIYNENEKKPLKSLIEMNYNKSCDLTPFDCIETENKNDLVNYSRYWHGQTIIEKVLLVFTTIKIINVINLLLIILLFFLAIKKLWKIDKKLMIGFILSLLSINLFFVTTSIQYNMVIYITLIITNLLLSMLQKKSKNIDVLFLISGMLTCFFDFLTAETLTLSIPLLIYIYIKQKDKELRIKEVIKLAILWLIGYSFTFLSKWIIASIHYGPHMFKEILNDANMRIAPQDLNNNKIIKSFFKSLSLLIPFNYLNNGGIIVLLLVITTFIFNLIYNKKNIVYNLLLIIPLSRFFIITSHSTLFYYFTYRSFAIIIPLIFFTIYDIIKEIIGDKEYEKE